MLIEIKKDLFRRYGKEEFSFFDRLKMNSIPQIKILKRKRLVDYYRDKNKILFLYHMAIYNRYKVKYNTDIPGRTAIGKGFVIEHIGNITLNPDTVIGDNCNIYNGVTIGIEKRGNRKGTPIIGNRVWMGPNSIIVGKIIIEDNVLIAPGAYVNFDVPKNSIVIGNPGKIISKIDATDYYISNLV